MDIRSCNPAFLGGRGGRFLQSSLSWALRASSPITNPGAPEFETSRQRSTHFIESRPPCRGSAPSVNSTPPHAHLATAYLGVPCDQPEAAQAVAHSGQFGLADFLGVKYISLFANGTLALISALQVLRISGEVITTPYSFVATTHSLWWNGIRPVFVDIEPERMNLVSKGGGRS